MDRACGRSLVLFRVTKINNSLGFTIHFCALLLLIIVGFCPSAERLGQSIHKSDVFNQNPNEGWGRTRTAMAMELLMLSIGSMQNYQ